MWIETDAAMYGQLGDAGTGTTNRKGTATRPAPATMAAVSSSTSPPPLIIAFQLACSSAASRTASVMERVNSEGEVVMAGGACHAASRPGSRSYRHQHRIPLFFSPQVLPVVSLRHAS